MLHIIIFDEIDAICKARGSSKDSTGVSDSIVNQLLSKIDGVDSLNNVLIIGMTNRKVRAQRSSLAVLVPVLSSHAVFACDCNCNGLCYSSTNRGTASTVGKLGLAARPVLPFAAARRAVISVLPGRSADMCWSAFVLC